jgi:hypothetical protein
VSGEFLSGGPVGNEIFLTLADTAPLLCAECSVTGAGAGAAVPLSSKLCALCTCCPPGLGGEWRDADGQLHTVLWRGKGVTSSLRTRDMQQQQRS